MAGRVVGQTPTTAIRFLWDIPWSSSDDAISGAVIRNRESAQLLDIVDAQLSGDVAGG
jgi:hypothetical protein